jgi:hypothetical protein
MERQNSANSLEDPESEEKNGLVKVPHGFLMSFLRFY